MDAVQIYEVFDKCPLLSLVEQSVKRKLAACVTVHTYELGESVYARGDPGDAMFFVALGRARVFGQDALGHDTTLAKIEAGGYFGEVELLSASPRTASARASDQLVLLRLARPDFDAWIKNSPGIRSALARCLADTSLVHFLKQFAILEGIPPYALRGLVGEMEEIHAQKGDTIVREGEDGDRFYLVRKGFLTVIKDIDSGPRVLGQLGEGEFFGELALLTNEARTATIIAEGPCELYSLSRDGFERAVATAPDLKKRLIERMKRYEDMREKKPASGPAPAPRPPTQDNTHPSTQNTRTGPMLELLHEADPDEPPHPPAKPVRAALRPLFPLLAETILASLLLSLFILALPLFTQAVVDHVLPAGKLDILHMLIPVVLLAILLAGLAALLRQTLLTHIMLKANARLLGDYFRHLFSLPVRHFQMRCTGEIAADVAELEKVRHTLIGSLPAAIMDAPLLLAGLSVMLAYHAGLTFVALGGGLIMLLILISVTPAIRRNRAERVNRDAAASSLLLEALNGAETIKASAAEIPLRRKLEQLYADSLLTAQRGSFLEALAASSAFLFSILLPAVLLALGAGLVTKGTLSTGALLAFCLMAGIVFGTFFRLASAWGTLQEARSVLSAMGGFFALPPEEPPDRALIRPPHLRGRIRLEQVSFAYQQGADPALAEINLEIQPGQMVALAGPSGSGKSTLARLILGLHTPNSGRVILDEHNLRDLSPPAVRRRIGLAQQDVFLLSGTIRENIALSAPDTPMDLVMAAAKRVGAHDFIIRMPRGYDSLISERGHPLSAEQRQRLGLARAMLHNPDILILDEATSALDAEAERALLENLKSAWQLTIVIITLRVASLRLADGIHVLHKGRIVETGSHNELTGKDGAYSLLVANQTAESS